MRIYLLKCKLLLKIVTCSTVSIRAKAVMVTKISNNCVCICISISVQQFIVVAFPTSLRVLDHANQSCC